MEHTVGVEWQDVTKQGWGSGGTGGKMRGNKHTHAQTHIMRVACLQMGHLLFLALKSVIGDPSFRLTDRELCFQLNHLRRSPSPGIDNVTKDIRRQPGSLTNSLSDSSWQVKAGCGRLEKSTMACRFAEEWFTVLSCIMACPLPHTNFQLSLSELSPPRPRTPQCYFF